MNRFGIKLRELRERNNQSQADLVRLTGLPASVIYRAESGETIPSNGTIKILEEKLGTKPGTLLEVAEAIRAEDDELWMGFPSTIFSAPLISLPFRFTAPFRLRAAHFFIRSQTSDIIPVWQGPKTIAFTKSEHFGFDGSSLMTSLVSGLFDCVWLPRKDYLAHRENLIRYATLGPNTLERFARVAESQPQTAPSQITIPDTHLELVTPTDGGIGSSWLISLLKGIETHVGFFNSVVPLVETVATCLGQRSQSIRDEIDQAGGFELSFSISLLNQLQK